jgi:hypothetical protein
MSIQDKIAELVAMEADESTPAHGVVYLIVNKITQRAYVGQTRNFVGRRQNHLRALRVGKHSNKALQADWSKYGEAAFLVRPVSEVECDALSDVTSDSVVNVVPRL